VQTVCFVDRLSIQNSKCRCWAIFAYNRSVLQPVRYAMLLIKYKGLLTWSHFLNGATVTEISKEVPPQSGRHLDNPAETNLFVSAFLKACKNICLSISRQGGMFSSEDGKFQGTQPFLFIFRLKLLSFSIQQFFTE